MTALKKSRMSRAEFLAWENAQRTKHEFVAGEIFALVGVRKAHNAISLNLALALREGLRDRPCQVYIAEVKAEIATADAILHPDVVVTCSETDTDEYLVREPVSIAEVLSPTTASYDTGRKFSLYQQLESLQEYVTVDTERVAVDHFRREPDGRWIVQVLGAGARIELTSLGIAIPVDALYAGIQFPTTGAPQP